jgi:hypothetical protein
MLEFRESVLTTLLNLLRDSLEKRSTDDVIKSEAGGSGRKVAVLDNTPVTTLRPKEEVTDARLVSRVEICAPCLGANESLNLYPLGVQVHPMGANSCCKTGVWSQCSFLFLKVVHAGQ